MWFLAFAAGASVAAGGPGCALPRGTFGERVDHRPSDVAGVGPTIADIYDEIRRRLQRDDYAGAAAAADRAVDLLGDQAPAEASARVLADRAALALAAGRSDVSSFYRLAVDAARAAYGAGAPEVGVALLDAGRADVVWGNEAHAAFLVDEAADVLRRSCGPEDATTLIAERAQGEVALATHRIGLAVYLLTDVQRRSIAVWGRDSEEVALVEVALGRAYAERGQSDESAVLLLHALGVLGPRDPRHAEPRARALSALARSAESRGDRERAEAYRWQLLRERLPARRSRPVPADRALAIAGDLVDVANLAALSGKMAFAEDTTRRALDLAATFTGEGHPVVVRALRQLAMLALADGRYTEFVALHTRAMRGATARSVRMTTGLRDFDQVLAVNAEVRADLRFAFRLAVQVNDAAVARYSAELVLNRKAFLAEAWAARAALPGLAEARESFAYDEVRGAFDERPDAADRARFALEEATQQQLVQAHPTAAAPAWTPLGDVVGALPPRGALIELVQAEADDETMHVVAWVVRSDRPLRVIDLGPAAPIDAAVAGVRDEVTRPSVARSTPPAAAERAFQQASRALAERILDPLEEALADVDDVVVSPDGSLWNVPWEALVDRAGQYLIERWSISYVSSGRHLATPDGARHGQGAVLFGGADFGPGGLWPPLPGAQRETQEVAAELAHRGVEPLVVHVGREATEGAAKQLVTPAILMFSTHAYASAQGAAGGGRGLTRLLVDRGVSPQDVVYQTDALAETGVVLTGANLGAEAKTPNDDGILTALEVLSLDLRGTDLVVLSACETGLGGVRPADGVVGLRTAFHLAGARNVVAALWSIPDEGTADLVTAMFEALDPDASVASALRSAKLHRIEDLRRADGAAHPWWWAGLTVSGPAGRL